jgi:hypothetical protein
MRDRSLLRDARISRRKALAYKGKPEFQFLFRVARAFEELAAKEDERGPDQQNREFKVRPNASGPLIR